MPVEFETTAGLVFDFKNPVKSGFVLHDKQQHMTKRLRLTDEAWSYLDLGYEVGQNYLRCNLKV